MPSKDSFDVLIQRELKEAGGEMWERKKLDENEIKGKISEFLLRD
jgi:hypothetical protein